MKAIIKEIKKKLFFPEYPLTFHFQIDKFNFTVNRGRSGKESMYLYNKANE